MSRIALLLIAATVLAPARAAPPAAPPQVTIYRCTDARGQLALRDSPCRAGERQQVRSMLRPTDAPRAAVSRPPARATAADVPRVVVRTAPRAVFECTTPDGERYTSASPEGNPRWVPFWTLGYPAVVGVPGMVEGGYAGSLESRRGGTTLRVEGGRRWRVPAYGAAPVVATGGTWIRDACSPLPASEACALLRDRRDELDRRWFSALQGDRDAITREQRGIDAQLAEGCP